MAKVTLLTTDEEAHWKALLPEKACVFAHPEFMRIVEEHTGQKAGLFVFESQGKRAVKPFFKRTTADLPFTTEDKLELWDLISPEYTGPMGDDIDQKTAQAFREQFEDFCHEENIIAEFAHLHPWNSNPELLVQENVEFNREIVYVDLTLPEETLWTKSFAHACRKNVKRAQREGVRVFQATSLDDVREFHRIYLDTMKRNRAHRRYYFSLEYFTKFFERMKGNAVFFLADYRDRIVAATLYLYDKTDVYSYLGGADMEFQHVRPTNAVIFELIRWAQRHGKKRFILGGGYRPDDGIFRFKATFSPLRARFHVYKRVYMPEKYGALCSAWSKYYQKDISSATYFPAYRSEAGPGSD